MIKDNLHPFSLATDLQPGRVSLLQPVSGVCAKLNIILPSKRGSSELMAAFLNFRVLVIWKAYDENELIPKP